MEKESFSWSKPNNLPGLIGRKKVDWSIFEDGTTIPAEFYEDFNRANNGRTLNPGDRYDVTLVIEGKEFGVSLRRVARLQLRYGSNPELRELLKTRFTPSYDHLAAERARHYGESDERFFAIVPDDLAEYMDFYETGKPFRYRVELITRSTQPTWTVPDFEQVWANLGSLLTRSQTLPTFTREVPESRWLADNGIEVKTDQGTAVIPKSAFEQAWTLLTRLGLMAVTDIPTSKSYTATAIAAVIAQLPHVDYTAHPTPVLFLKGFEFTNDHLTKGFGGGLMGGIRTAGEASEPIQVLFTTDAPSVTGSDHPYSDRWEGDTFLYCGFGKKGDQELVKGNLALKRNMDKDFPIYGFQKLGPNKYRYMGRFKVYKVTQDQQPDTEQNMRSVYIFHMKRLDSAPPLPDLDYTREEAEKVMVAELVLPPARLDLAAVQQSFSAALKASHISFGQRHDELVRYFVAALATKRLVILTGLSGSGKTQIALRFGQWLGPDRFKVIAVRPDWTGAEALFGYEDGLQPPDPVTGYRAWNVPEALKFMLRAAGDPHHPYLLVLDEMNLAHVERYFADVLSGMESEEPCLPNLALGKDGQWRQADSDSHIPVPRNLFIVGTVNVDETTYMFSPKVLDRANTFEFRVETDELVDKPQKPQDCDPGEDDLVRGFLAIAQDDAFHINQPAPQADAFSTHFRRLHQLLREENFEFGHRTFYEAIRFASMLAAIGETASTQALDAQMMQKVLPRLHGTRRRLEGLLCGLGQYCFDLNSDLALEVVQGKRSFDLLKPPEGLPVLPRSFDKLRRMLKGLLANQFTSFTE